MAMKQKKIFEKEKSKIKIADSKKPKKTDFIFSANYQYFFAKISEIGPNLYGHQAF